MGHHMLEEREVVAAIVALAVSLFFFVNRVKLATVPHARLLGVSFGLLVASLVCSAIEVVCWEELFNFLQHALTPSSLVLLAIWSWLTFVRHDGVSV